MDNTKIYYEDQGSWTAEDFYGLWRYLNRLFQYIGPTPAAAADPESQSARIQAKRTGKRDEELRSLDLSRMTAETKYLMRHMLIQTERYDLALKKFSNLRGLADVGELGHPLYLSEHPTFWHAHLTEMGIYL